MIAAKAMCENFYHLLRPARIDFRKDARERRWWMEGTEIGAWGEWGEWGDVKLMTV